MEHATPGSHERLEGRVEGGRIATAREAEDEPVQRVFRRQAGATVPDDLPRDEVAEVCEPLPPRLGRAGHEGDVVVAQDEHTRRVSAGRGRFGVPGDHTGHGRLLASEGWLISTALPVHLAVNRLQRVTWTPGIERS
ncbi:MAG TPA: hypothetical protein RMH99_19710 [Sandaracinaceae bacterium LLY-WYZ-13_1]|nr:hypothetical protein [Sandaracinaceae bacterium LLY-WYZ-13_1]